MRTRSKLILAGLTASLLMGLAVSSATAGRLSVSNTRYRVTWATLTFFSLESEVTIRCPVTLEGSFHSATIRKTPRALIGAVTRAIVNGGEPPCIGGRATILQESLPWHITYESFRGTLPRIEEITLLLRRYEFRIEPGLIACLYLDQNRPEENLAGILRVAPETGQITTLTPLSGRYASWRSGSVFCPRRGAFEGTGQVFLQGSSSIRITVTLI
jgi:hypothetical protein